jgi:hypothetical protein
MKRRGGFFIFAFILLLAISGCGKEGDSSPPSAGGPPIDDTPGGNLPSTKISRIKITPGAFLLTEPGKSVQLSAQAYDAEGSPIDAAITWKTSDEAAVTITAEGLATAVGAVGSAQITAQAEGVSSGPVLALLAQPVSGAVLVQDDQVIGIPEAVDPAVPYGVGWRYRVTLSGIGLPNPGDILVGVGEAAIGGRVVEAATDGTTITVTLEIVSLEELFVDLKIRETIDLSRADYRIPEEIAATYDVQRLPDGRFQFIPKADQPAPKPERQAPSMAPLAAPSDPQFSLGPFKCNATVGFTLVQLNLSEQATLTFLPNLNIDFDYDSAAGGLQKLLASGAYESTIEVGVTLNTGVDGKVTCKAQIAQLLIPMPGPLALLFSGQVPVGAGFELNGKVNGAWGFKGKVQANADAQLGIDCTGECQMISAVEGETNSEIKPVFNDLPNPDVEMNVRGFGYADVKFGNPWLQFLQFEAFKVELGPKLQLKLKPADAQALDPTSASEYRLFLSGVAGAGNSFAGFMNMLQLTLLKVEFKLEAEYARSPTGNLTITPAAVKPGDGIQAGELATFTVTLDSSTFLGIESVEGVEIMWLKNGALEPGRPGCASLPAAPGETVFTCQADFLVEHLGEQKFYAFVKANLFGLLLPMPLEVADNSAAKVMVNEGGPAAPTALSATDVAGDNGGAIALTWTPSPSTAVTSQRVYRSTTSGGPYMITAIVGNTAATYTDTGLTNGATYYYVLRAFDGTQESADSNEVAAASAAPVVRLLRRVHGGTATHFTNAYLLGRFAEIHEVRYTGAEDSLEPYNDSSNPAAHTVHAFGFPGSGGIANDGSTEGIVQQSVSFVSDGNGNISSVAGSASFTSQSTVTSCFSDNDCNPGVSETQTVADLPAGDNYVEFIVEGEPVAYTLSGNLGVTSNDERASEGVLSFQTEDFRACSGGAGGDCMLVDETLGQTITVPANVDLSSSGILPPGRYTLRIGLKGESYRGALSGALQVGTTQASGSVNFTLTFSPAP